MIIKRRHGVGRFDTESGALAIAGITPHPHADVPATGYFQANPDSIVLDGFNRAGLFAEGAEETY